MLYHGSVAGAFDLKTVVMESLEGMRRAGQLDRQTDMIHTHTFSEPNICEGELREDETSWSVVSLTETDSRMSCS